MEHVRVRRVHRRMLVLAAAMVCSALLAGCGEQERTVRVVSDRTGDVERVDLPPRGKSPGEVVAFSSVLLDARERRPVGRVHGTQTSIRTEGRSETVQGLLTFQLGRGDEIVVGGLSEASGNGTVVGRRYVRPVLGGTGEYAGAKGTLTTFRRPDGRYEQEFRLSGLTR